MYLNRVKTAILEILNDDKVRYRSTDRLRRLLSTRYNSIELTTQGSILVSTVLNALAQLRNEGKIDSFFAVGPHGLTMHRLRSNFSKFDNADGRRLRFKVISRLCEQAARAYYRTHADEEYEILRDVLGLVASTGNLERFEAFKCSLARSRYARYNVQGFIGMLLDADDVVLYEEAAAHYLRCSTVRWVQFQGGELALEPRESVELAGQLLYETLTQQDGVW